MKNILLIIVSVSLLFSSCKKEELNGDLAYLEGKWKLYASVNSSAATIDYFDDDHEKMTYLTFFKCGKIVLQDKNDKIIGKGRVKSIEVTDSPIYPDGKSYRIEIGTYGFKSKKLKTIDFILLYSTVISPLEINTKDIIYESPYLELVWRKI